MVKSFNDYDGDGCRDETEDLDDDNDGICDAGNDDTTCTISAMASDLCPYSSLEFDSNSVTDNDGDGCEDATEDDDDDNDGYADEVDDCPLESGSSFNDLTGCLDTDYDGYTDSQDAFPLDTSQWADTDNDGYGDEVRGTDGDYCPDIAGTSTKDRIGCLDSDGDGWSNPDSVWNVNLGGDAFPDDATQHFDGDQDGYGDNAEGNQQMPAQVYLELQTWICLVVETAMGMVGPMLLMRSPVMQHNGQTKMEMAMVTKLAATYQMPVRQNLVTRRLLAMVALIPMVTD